MRLRSACRLTLQQFRGEPSYVLEDTLSGHFFQLGLREEKLVRGLDGSRTGIELLEECQKQEGESFDPNELLMLLSSLRSSGLLEGCPADDASPSLLRQVISKNPLFLRIPIGNPDPILSRAERYLRWLFHPWTLLLIGALFISAVFVIGGDWQRFTDKAQSVLAADNWLWLFLTFIGLKLVHEAGHGVVCKHFGGRVPEFGLYFMFFTPLTYVDATSSWAFPSRHIRVLVSAAGMIAEMFVASIAAFVWVSTETGAINTLAYNTIFSATVVTLLFNLNPLLRFDGYYILSDLTGVPNLYTRASTAASGWIKLAFFGTAPNAPEEVWIGVYGLACMVWRFLLTLSICIGAIVLLQGVGVVLAALYLIGMGLPTLRKISFRSLPRGKPAVRAAIVSLVLIGVLCIPIRYTITAPAVIQPANLTSIRVACPGFLRELFVTPGQIVAKDALLARMSNPEEVARLNIAETMAKITAVEAHHARVKRDPQLEAKKVEALRSLESQVAEIDAFCKTLEIRAPHDGIVIGREISNLLGSFLQTGQELFAIGSADLREAHILIPEEYAQVIPSQPGDLVRVFLRNQGRAVSGTLTRIEPRANRKIRFPQVTASAGGPVTVRRQERAGDETPSGLEMVQPHFIAVAALTNPPPLLAGETCIVRLQSTKSQILAVYLWHRFEALIRTYIGRSEHTPV